METFKFICMLAMAIISLYLCYRCIVLTKALSMYYSLLNALINEEVTNNQLKILMAAMYKLDVKEIDRRLKDGN